MILKTSKHIYAHIDCDSFFASCEVLNNPKLVGKYVCVGSEIIVAATYNAKQLGVKVGTPVWEAKKILKNKDAYFSGVHMDSYINISRKLMKYLKQNTLDVRIFSIDEAFVEISGLPELAGQDIEDYLSSLQQNILREIGVPVSIGVSNTRLKAKIFSKLRKPFGICVGIDMGIEKEIFQGLSFREIPFIGSQTAKKLDHYISSLQDYVDIGYFDIMRRFGKNGGKIWLELRGVSSMSFRKKGTQKSMGRARGFNREMTSDTGVLLMRIKTNLDRMCDELYYKGYEIQNISLLLIDSNWKKYKAYKDFSCYTSDRKVIFLALKELFLSIYDPYTTYRKTGVFTSQIQSIENKQMSLFLGENTSHRRNLGVEKLMYDLDEKYGKGTLKIGFSEGNS